MASTDHALQIRSLRDTDASCSCGMWSMLAITFDRDKDDDLRARVVEQHNRHLESVARREARKGKASP